MDLDEFAVGVVHALLEKRRLRRARAHHGVCRAAKNRADSAATENYGVGGERSYFHSAQIHGADSAAHSAIIQNSGQKCEAFVFLNFSLGFVASHLFVERVKKLLTRRRSCKRGAVIKSAAKAPIIEQSFRSAIEHHAHAVQQINNSGSRFAHSFYQRLIGQKITAIDSVVEMLGAGIAFAFLIFRRVDAALRADRVRAFYRYDGKQIDRHGGFGNANGGHQSGQSSAHYDDFRLSHRVM